MGNYSPFLLPSSDQVDAALTANYVEDTNVKFPTFLDNSIEDILNSGISLETLSAAIYQCDILLKDLQNTFRTKLMANTALIQGMAKHKFYIEVVFLQFIHLCNQIELWYSLFQYKFSSSEREKEDYETFITELKSIYLAFEDPEQYINSILIPQYNPIYSSIDETVRPTLISEITVFYDFIKEIFLKESRNYKPSLVSSNMAVQFLISLLNGLYKSLAKVSNELIDGNLFAFLKDVSFIDKSAHSFYMIYSMAESDIFNQNELGEEWSLIKKHYKRIIISPRETVQEQLQSVFGVARLGYASVSKAFGEWNDSVMRTIGTGIYMVYFFFNRKQADIQADKYLMRTEGAISQKIWNLLDVFPINQMLKLLLPSIKYCKFFYLKRTMPPITLEYLAEAFQHIKDFEHDGDDTDAASDDLSFTHYRNKKQKYYCCTDEQEQNIIMETIETGTETNEEYVKVKLMSTSYIYDKNYTPGYLNMFSPERKTKTRQSIIVHVHGGGFTAMSSSSHQMYTRKWCNGLDVPVFSIDYRLSPEYTFPCALDDVYQAYCWLIKYGEEYFNIEINNIILTGDSAGGNLVLSLTYILIMNNLRLPNVIFMFYPALKMTLDIFSNSYFNAVTDQILELNLLKYCSSSYQGPNQLDPKNPFFSPLFMDNNILQQLPPVRLLGGSADPLRDDSIYFLHKLIKLNKDVDMIELKYFTHAFLNYDMKFMMKEAAKATELIISEFNKFIPL